MAAIVEDLREGRFCFTMVQKQGSIRMSGKLNIAARRLGGFLRGFGSIGLIPPRSSVVSISIYIGAGRSDVDMIAMDFASVGSDMMSAVEKLNSNGPVLNPTRNKSSRRRPKK